MQPVETTGDQAQDSTTADCGSPDDRSYGSTEIGKWLTNLLETVGAPEEKQITLDEIRDTGTALEVHADVYDSRIWAYITAQRPPDSDFPPEGAEPIGRHGDFVLYYWEDRSIKAFNAVSPDWQLSLLAYPARGQATVSWAPDDQHVGAWFQRAIDAAQQNPPPCS